MATNLNNTANYSYITYKTIYGMPRINYSVESDAIFNTHDVIL